MNTHTKYVSIIVPVVFVFMLSFNNMTPQKQKLSVEEIIENSKEMSRQLKDSRVSDKLKQHTRKRKLITVNYLSAKVLATSCNDLLRLDGTIETGIYTLFPTGKLTEPQTVQCSVGKSGKVVSELPIGDLNIVNVCDGPHGCNKSKRFFKDIKCVSNSSDITSCEANRVYGFPIIKKVTHGDCKPGDYGFEEDTGIWVINGCGAIFTMNRIPKVDVEQGAVQEAVSNTPGKNKKQ